MPNSSPGRRLRDAYEAGAIMVPGVFNALVAKMADQLGFPALYLSGGALSATHGIPDVGLLGLAEFTAAARSDRGAYPPAFQAAIYLQLNGRDWKSAAAMCREFAEALVNAPEAWESDLAWSADARRLGEFVSAAQLLVTTADDVKLWAELDLELRKALPETLQAEYVTGFENVIVRQTELTAKFEETKQDAAEAEEQQNVVALKEVVDSRQKVALVRPFGHTA